MHGTVYTDVLEHRTDCSRGRDAVTQGSTPRRSEDDLFCLPKKKKRPAQPPVDQ